MEWGKTGELCFPELGMREGRTRTSWQVSIGLGVWLAKMMRE